MTGLKIAPRTTLPPEMVTETVAMLAKRGMGKSNAAVVLAEEMTEQGFQWVAIDPKGDWWGIRASESGKGPGLSVPVFGGRHGDLPLEHTAGALMAQLIASRNLTCVLDVSLFTKEQQIKFVTDFAETLFREVAGDPRPMHLFLEEAEEFLPQRVDARSARMVGAYSKISKQGRTSGLGVTLITQRSASLNKDALSQTDTLILFRTTSPHDRKAVVAWAEHHMESKEIAESLSQLAPGESWILSPGFLGKIERVKWRRRRTFDSGATPIAGMKRREPTSLADIDLDEIRVLMADTIEKAEASDPTALQKTLRTLKSQVDAYERQVAELKQELTNAPTETVVQEVPVFEPGQLLRLEELLEPVARVLGEVQERLEWATKVEDDKIVMTRVEKQLPPPRVPRRPERPPKEPHPTSPTLDLTGSGAEQSLGSGAPFKLLQVLANYPQGCPKGRAAMLIGVNQRKSTIRNAMSKLRTLGYMTNEGDMLWITDEGLAAAGPIEPLPQGPELLAHWRSELGGAPLDVFNVMVEAWPARLTPTEIAESAGLDPGKSTIRNAFSKLRTLGIVEGTQLAPDFVQTALA